MAGQSASVWISLVCLLSSACLSEVKWKQDEPSAQPSGGPAPGKTLSEPAAKPPRPEAPPPQDTPLEDTPLRDTPLRDTAGPPSAPNERTKPPVFMNPLADPEKKPSPSCASIAATCPYVLPPPSPCAGIAYSVPLQGEGGVAPYHFDVETAAPGFALRRENENTAFERTWLESVSPSSGGSLRVRVTDASDPPQSSELTFDLGLRQTCWFAYLSNAGSERLHLRDVFLRQDVIADSGIDGTTSDFRFSPDGDWIAFRVERASRSELYVFRAREPRAAALPVPGACAATGTDGCQMLDYAWSPDSQHLAFVQRSAGSDARDELAGVTGFQGGSLVPAWNAQSTALWVGQEVPLRYREQLIWSANDTLAFLGDELSIDDLFLSEALYSARLAADGSALNVPTGMPSMLTSAGTLARAVAGGVVLVSLEETSMGSVVSYQGSASAMLFSGWLAPGGDWVAQTSSNAELEIYDVRDDTSPVVQTLTAPVAGEPAATGPCQEVSAWSEPLGEPPVERIACRSVAGLSFFELSSASRSLRLLARVDAVPSAGVRRAFSPEGRWFVFGEADGVTFDMIDLDAPSPRIDALRMRLEVSPVELAFPPRRVGLVQLADAKGLAEYPLPGSTSLPSAFISSGSSPRSSCSELIGLATGNWCGAPQAAAHSEYSADSRSALFEDAPGSLSIAQPGSETEPALVTASLAPCAGACASKPYAFQP